MQKQVFWLWKTNNGHTLNGDANFLGPQVVRRGTLRKQMGCAPFRFEICKGQSIAIGVVGPEIGIRHLPVFFESARGDELRWRPSVTETTDSPNVPTHIAEAATEAYECHSCEHYRGAIML